VEVQLYSFFNLGAGWGWVFNATPRSLYPRERLLMEAGWAPEPDWTGEKGVQYFNNKTQRDWTN